MGILSVNEVAWETSSYSSRWDEETARMKARMDAQQVRLDSLEDLLDVIVVGNPLMQRALDARRRDATTSYRMHRSRHSRTEHPPKLFRERVP